MSMDKENYILTEIAKFNFKNDEVKNSIDVLYRVICSVMQVIENNNLKVNLFRTFDAGTIFTRTCRYRGGGGGVCGVDLDGHTTFTNLTTLGNLMISNPRSVNDSVLFLRAKRDVKFLDLNIISQLFGAQVKSGVRPSSRLGGDNSRGIFSGCCRIPEMPAFCRRFGVMGVIQTDSADAYYFNTDEEWFPAALKQGTGARHLANELVLEALQNKRAYPVSEYNDSNEAYVGSEMHAGSRDQRLTNSGALFPEFNFHIDGALGGLTNYLEYCQPDDPLFGARGSLNAIVPAAHQDHATAQKADGSTVQIPCFSLNEILSDAAAASAYLNFQKDLYSFEQIAQYDWVLPFHTGVLQINPEIIQRERNINHIFNSNFVGLPYLCSPSLALTTAGANIIDIEGAITDMIFNDSVPIPLCGISGRGWQSASAEKPLGREGVRRKSKGWGVRPKSKGWGVRGGGTRKKRRRRRRRKGGAFSLFGKAGGKRKKKSKRHKKSHRRRTHRRRRRR